VNNKINFGKVLGFQ